MTTYRYIPVYPAIIGQHINIYHYIQRLIIIIWTTYRYIINMLYLFFSFHYFLISLCQNFKVNSQYTNSEFFLVELKCSLAHNGCDIRMILEIHSLKIWQVTWALSWVFVVDFMTCLSLEMALSSITQSLPRHTAARNEMESSGSEFTHRPLIILANVEKLLCRWEKKENSSYHTLYQTQY